MWLEGLLLLIAICYGCHLWGFSYWKRRGVFQLDGSFIFGNIKDVLFMKKSMNSFILDIYMKHKQHKIIGIYSFYTPMLMVTDPEVMRQVMVKDFNSFAGPPMDVYENVDPMFGINPFCTHGIETWKERRGLHASLLSPSKLKAMPDLIINVGRNMINYIKKNNGEIKVKELADLYAIDSVCCFSYGCEPSSFTDPENSFRKHAGDTLFDSDSAQAINGGFLYPFITNLFRYRVVTKVCQDFFVAMCRKMMEFRMKNPSNRPDFFEHMGKANTKLILDGKKGFTDLEIAGHCMTIYFDSFFTTSSGFSYLLIELSKNPDLQEKLRSEILNCGKNMEDFDYEKINSLRLLHMAMNESLRIHSPVPVSLRTCTKTTELEGAIIKEGTRVLLPYFAFHLDPQYYPEPKKYMPERYLDEETLVKGTLLPFGDGPRMCLGFRYASLLIKTGVIYLLLNFVISGEENTDEVDETENLFPFHAPEESKKLLFSPLCQH